MRTMTGNTVYLLDNKIGLEKIDDGSEIVYIALDGEYKRVASIWKGTDRIWMASTFGLTIRAQYKTDLIDKIVLLAIIHAKKDWFYVKDHIQQK